MPLAVGAGSRAGTVTEQDEAQGSVWSPCRRRGGLGGEPSGPQWVWALLTGTSRVKLWEHRPRSKSGEPVTC